MKKNDILKSMVVALALSPALHSGAAEEKSLVDFFLPMEPQAELVGAESGVWGTDNVFPRDTANGLEDPLLQNSCYWDGGIVKDDDGKYHIYASRWGQEYTHHDGWTRQSLGVHAVSDNVMGPYREENLIYPDWTPLYLSDKEKKDYALPGWGHNVFGFRMHDGRYGVVSSEITPGDVFASDSPYGPFEYLGRIEVDNNGFTEGLAKYGNNDHMANVMILPRPDGKYMIIARNMAPMISENGVTGPYKIMNYPVYSQRLDLFQTQNEDPTVWYSGGLYHVVYNHWPTAKCYHFTSKDGLTDWRYRGMAYDKQNTQIFKYTDGTVNQWRTVERPTAVMGDDGHVTHFHFSVINQGKGDDAGNDRDGSKIVIVPFDGKAFDEYMAEVVKNDPAQEELAIDASNQTDDENVLNSLVYSFEKIGPNEACMWHLQHKDNFIPTTEKVMHGAYSMKYVLDDTSVTDDLQIQGAFNSELIKAMIPDGEYEFSVNFWVSDEAPTEVEFPFSSVGNYFSVKFDLTGVERNKWVKLTKKVQIKDFTDKNYKINIIVRRGQQGLMYMDQIVLKKIADLADNTGFGNEPMMGFEVEDGDGDGADGWWAFNPEVWFRSADQAKSGDYSLCCKMDMGKGKKEDGSYVDPWIQTDDDDEANACRIMEVGEYQFQYDLYVASGANGGLKEIYSFCTSNGWTARFFKGVQLLEKDKWYTVTLDKMMITEIKENAKGFMGSGKTTFKINKDAADEDDVLFYIDNFCLVKAGAQAAEQGISESCRVLAQDGKVVVVGATIGERISVYDLDGKCMTEQLIDCAVVNIPLKRGVFVVCVNGQSYKVNV